MKLTPYDAKVHMRCFCFLITSHPLLRQAHHRLIRPGWMSLSSCFFMVWCRACPWIPGCLSNLMVDVAMKPLQPTSSGQTAAFKPRCSGIKWLGLPGWEWHLRAGESHSQTDSKEAKFHGPGNPETKLNVGSQMSDWLEGSISCACPSSAAVV